MRIIIIHHKSACAWYTFVSHVDQGVQSLRSQVWFILPVLELFPLDCSHCGETGRFADKAGCYAVIVIADNAKFSLAVNRMTAFCPQSPKWSHSLDSSAALVQLVEHLPLNIKVMGSSPTWYKILSCGIILYRFRLIRQLQYHPAFHCGMKSQGEQLKAGKIDQTCTHSHAYTL